MLIREMLEERERKELASDATFSASSRGREIPEEECEMRTAFAKDRDRIVHSRAFRLLKDKTQVFFSSRMVAARTRLTHTLEVSAIARTIARALRLNEDLVEAISLGHDLGHTPFGHLGEDVLDRLLPGGFRHAQQSLRVVTSLEKDGKGLNLTWEVRDGIARHSKSHEGVVVKDDSRLASTLEGRVVMIADSIAYLNHDIDDSIRYGVISKEDIPKELLDTLGERHSVRIDRMVHDVVVSGLETREIRFSPEMAEASDALRKFMFSHVYGRADRSRDAELAREIIEELFDYCKENTELLAPVNSTDSVERKAADYIASLTDSEALALVRKVRLEKRKRASRKNIENVFSRRSL